MLPPPPPPQCRNPTSSTTPAGADDRWRRTPPLSAGTVNSARWRPPTPLARAALHPSAALPQPARLGSGPAQPSPCSHAPPRGPAPPLAWGATTSALYLPPFSRSRLRAPPIRPSRRVGPDAPKPRCPPNKPPSAAGCTTNPLLTRPPAPYPGVLHLVVGHGYSLRHCLCVPRHDCTVRCSEEETPPCPALRRPRRRPPPSSAPAQPPSALYYPPRAPKHTLSAPFPRRPARRSSTNSCSRGSRRLFRLVLLRSQQRRAVRRHLRRTAKPPPQRGEPDRRRRGSRPRKGRPATAPPQGADERARSPIKNTTSNESPQRLRAGDDAAWTAWLLVVAPPRRAGATFRTMTDY